MNTVEDPFSLGNNEKKAFLSSIFEETSFGIPSEWLRDEKSSALRRSRLKSSSSKAKEPPHFTSREESKNLVIPLTKENVAQFFASEGIKIDSPDEHPKIDGIIENADEAREQGRKAIVHLWNKDEELRGDAELSSTEFPLLSYQLEEDKVYSAKDVKRIISQLKDDRISRKSNREASVGSNPAASYAGLEMEASDVGDSNFKKIKQVSETKEIQMEDDEELMNWVTKWRETKDEKNAVSFKKRFAESEKRFKEQLEIHREITNAMEHIKQIERETKVLQSERRTTALVTTLLQRQNAALLRTFPSEAPFWKQMEEEEERLSKIAMVTPPYYLQPQRNQVNDANAAGKESKVSTSQGVSEKDTKPKPVDPMLEILAQFSKPKVGTTPSETSQRSKKKGSESNNANSAPAKKVNTNYTTAYEQEPIPYLRTRWVLDDNEQSGIDKRTENSESAAEDEIIYADDFDEDNESSAVEEEYAWSDEVIEDNVSQSESIVSDEVESETNSTNDSSISDRVSDSIADDVQDSLSRRSSSQIISSYSEAVSEDLHKRSHSNNKKSDRKKIANLQEVLKQFYDACRAANNLSKILAGKSHVPRWKDSEGRSSSSEESNGSSDPDEKGETVGRNQWTEMLRKEFIDIKRLRRFNKHIQKNIKAIDLERGVRAQKRKLVEEAVRLSKAKKKQKLDRKARIKDLVDDDVGSVLDSLDSSLRRRRAKKGRKKRKSSDSDIEDEIISDYDDVMSYNGSEIGEDDMIEDEIEEDDFDSSDSSAIDDEIDEDEDMEWDIEDSSVIDEDDIDDEITQEDEIYDEDFEDLANSDAVLDEVEDDYVDRLASYSISEVEEAVSEVDFNDLPSSSSASEISDDASGAKNSSLDSAVKSEDAAIIEDEIKSDDNRSKKTSDSDIVSVSVKERRSSHALTNKTSASDAQDSSDSVSSHSSDADVSSPYPSSSATSFSMNSSDLSSVELREGEEALRELEEDLRQTKHRRKKAVAHVDTDHPRVETFSALYNASVPSSPESSDSNDSETAAVAKSESKGTSETEETDSQPLLPIRAFEVYEIVPPSEQVKDETIASPLPAANLAANETTVATPNAISPLAVEDPHQRDSSSNTVDDDQAVAVSAHKYLADDFVAQIEWKRRQKELFKQILPSTSTPLAPTTAEEQEEFSEKDSSNFARHWGVLEALLETRFNSKNLPDYEDWSSEQDSAQENQLDKTPMNKRKVKRSKTKQSKDTTSYAQSSTS